MGTLERRVQVLIREAVGDRLDRRRRDSREALERLFASGNEVPTRGPIDWEAEKDAFEHHDYGLEVASFATPVAFSTDCLPQAT